MASPVPEKLQPLHNFLQTHLKWKNHRSGSSRLVGGGSSSSPPASDPWLEPPPLRSHTHAPSSPLRHHTSPPNASSRPSSPDKQSVVHDTEFRADPNYAVIERASTRKLSESSTKSVDCRNKRKQSNEISIRFGGNSKQHDTADEGNRSSTPMNDSVPPKAANDKSSPKTWNLRSRRPPGNHNQSIGGLPKIGTSGLQENKTYREINSSKQLSELNNNYNSDTRTTALPKISIALYRGEIEEDILFLTGSKPSRRSKKRPKAIQRQLDNLFPGLWLDSITADSYKVSETPPKE